jgi:hypothetical protein
VRLITPHRPHRPYPLAPSGTAFTPVALLDVCVSSASLRTEELAGLVTPAGASDFPTTALRAPERYHLSPGSAPLVSSSSTSLHGATPAFSYEKRCPLLSQTILPRTNRRSIFPGFPVLTASFSFFAALCAR